MIDLFERTDLSERQKRALWALQARVYPRMIEAAGQLHWIRAGDMLHGKHATIVMSSFTHTRNPTRFSNGLFGIYYASQDRDTAIYETAFHKQRYANERGVRAQNFNMRVWVGEILKACYDVRRSEYDALHASNDYAASQNFTRWLLGVDPDAFGLVYRSVRNPGGSCLAALRPITVSRPKQGAHLIYYWNGFRVTHAAEQTDPIVTFN